MKKFMLVLIVVVVGLVVSNSLIASPIESHDSSIVSEKDASTDYEELVKEISLTKTRIEEMETNCGLDGVNEGNKILSFSLYLSKLRYDHFALEYNSKYPSNDPLELFGVKLSEVPIRSADNSSVNVESDISADSGITPELKTYYKYIAKYFKHLNSVRNDILNIEIGCDMNYEFWKTGIHSLKNDFDKLFEEYNGFHSTFPWKRFNGKLKKLEKIELFSVPFGVTN